MRRILVALALVALPLAVWLGWPVGRPALGITTANSATPQCRAPVLPDLRATATSGADEGCTEPGGCANKEHISAAFLPYAVASLNAYGATGRRAGDLSKLDPSWKLIREPLEFSNGLGYAVFTRDVDNELHVLVAFRGTDTMAAKGWLSVFPSVTDFIANSSWITQWFNPWDQYRGAREAFAGIRNQAFSDAKGRTVRFHLTGHSLGGGLAQHIARGFPCTAAVVFNPSCVSNRVRFSEPYMDNQIVDIRENRDWLTATVCAPSGLFGWGARHQVYEANWIGDRARANLDEIDVALRQHYIGNMTFAMGRTILCCVQNERHSSHGSCGCQNAVKKSVDGAKRLICEQRRAAQASAATPKAAATRRPDPCDFSPVQASAQQCKRRC